MGNRMPRERSLWAATVAAQIRAEQGAMNVTMKEFSRLAGIPRNTYWKLQAGETIADTDQIAKICGALGIPVSEFYRRVEARFVVALAAEQREND